MGYSLGIDLGTTYTAAAVVVGGRAEVVSLGNHAVTIPSAVFLRDDGEVIVGDAAVRRGEQEPNRLAREFKRRFGDATPILLGHTPYSAERLMAAVLQQTVALVAERHGSQPDAVAIAHPANWGAYRIDLLRQAAQLAGLSEARFVSEPEGAAVHFAGTTRLADGDVVAVYDLGGGTFDAAVLRRTPGGFRTLGEPQGIERLGGIDFDEAVLSHVRATLGDALTRLDADDPAVRAGLVRLRAECQAAKEALSADSETSVNVMLPGLQTQVRFTRNEFEDAIRPALRETVQCLQRAVAGSEVAVGDIKAVVLAGGSSRIPLVKELVGELGIPVAVDAHPKHTVALGAALVASTPASPAAPAGAAASAAAAAPPAPSPGPTARPSAPAPTEADAAHFEPLPDAPADRQGPPGGVDRRGAAAPPTASAAAGGSTSRRTGLAIGAAVVALAAIVGTVLLLGRDGDGGGGGGDDDPAVEAPDTGDDCASDSGRCVVIESLTIEGRDLLAAYRTIGFEPRIVGSEDDHHLHFFFDTVPLEDAGTPGAGPWKIWDVDSNGEKLFHGEGALTVDDIPDDATQLCAVVSTHRHAVDEDPVPSCVDLP